MIIELSPQGLLNCFFRQQRKILAIFVFCMACAIISIFACDTLYESTGSLLVKFGPNATPDVSHGKERYEELSQNDRRGIIQSDTEILQSHDLVAQAVKETGVETLYPGLSAKVAGKDSPVEAAVKRLVNDDMDVKAGQQSNIITVSVMNRNSAVAAHFLFRLLALFIPRQSNVFRNPHLDFLSAEAAQANASLEKSQRTLANFRTNEGISTIDEELAQLLAEKEDADTIAFQAVDDAQAKLADMEARKAQMLTTYRASSPQLKQLQKSIDVARQQIVSQQEDLQDREAAIASQGIVGMRIHAINSRIHRLEALRSQYDDLVRQVRIDEENYKDIRTHSEEAKLNEMLNRQNITSIAIIDAPEVAVKPARPRKLLILAMGFITGILCSLGAALYIETYDERFSTPQQVSSALRLPVMASFIAIHGEAVP